MTIKELELECQQARQEQKQAEAELRQMPMNQINSPAGFKLFERIDAARQRFVTATVKIGKLILHD